MNVLLLYNSAAGDEEHTPRHLVALLRRHGYKPTATPIDRGLRNKKLLGTAELVVVAGGDGSVKAAALALAGTGRSLAVLPTGTANNIAGSLGISGSPEQIIPGWSRAQPISIDLGIAEGPWGRKPFVESAGVGLIGRAIAVVHRIDSVSAREPGDRGERLYRDLCVLMTLALERQARAIRVQWDEGPVRSADYLIFEVMNMARGGPGVEWVSRANPTDRRLDVVSVKDSQRNLLENALERCLAGKEHGGILPSRRASRVSIALADAEVRVDDTVVWPQSRRGKSGRSERVEFTIGVWPGAVQCLLPVRGGRR